MSAPPGVGAGYIRKELLAPTPEEARIAELQAALQSVLDAYYRVSDVIPKKMLAYQLLTGHFEPVVLNASRILCSTNTNSAV